MNGLIRNSPFKISRASSAAPVFAVVISLLILPCARAADFPVWGRDSSRNMVAEEKGLPESFHPGKPKSGSEEIDMAATKNVKWVTKLGSQSYGNPVVSGGKIFIGTNNETPRDPKYKGDHGILMCLDEKTGKLLWQLAVPKLGAGKVSDWEYLGICSAPAVDGDRVYIVTNRCEVMCLDVNGNANGNDGEFKDEAKYVAGSGKPPIEQGATDADIIWKFDMREELGVFPHNITSSSVLIVGDRLYATTSNGQDWSHLYIPAPQAPSLICLDKKTGKYLGEETSGISNRLYHCNWSSPALATIGGKPQIIFGAGDGFCYGFDPAPEPGKDGINSLKELWRFDCNPPEHKIKDGKPIKYPAAEGPCEIIATPVVYKNRVFVGVGQDPEHGEGVGNLACIDPTKTGDITKTGSVWSFNKIGRSISSASIVGDLLFMADYSGRVFCLDATSGNIHWEHNLKAHIWGSTLGADGKIYIGGEDGSFLIFSATKEKKILGEATFPNPIYSTAIAANGVLYVATPTHLYAIANPGATKPEPPAK